MTSSVGCVLFTTAPATALTSLSALHPSPHCTAAAASAPSQSRCTVLDVHLPFPAHVSSLPFSCSLRWYQLPPSLFFRSVRQTV